MAAGFPRNPSCPSGKPDHPPVRAGKGGCCDSGEGRTWRPHSRPSFTSFTMSFTRLHTSHHYHAGSALNNKHLVVHSRCARTVVQLPAERSSRQSNNRSLPRPPQRSITASPRRRVSGALSAPLPLLAQEDSELAGCWGGGGGAHLMEEISPSNTVLAPRVTSTKAPFLSLPSFTKHPAILVEPLPNTARTSASPTCAYTSE
eukprot:7217499-Pyramimonas_sp.AAC.1